MTIVSAHMERERKRARDELEEGGRQRGRETVRSYVDIDI